MKISATSALVLNWSSMDLWKCKQTLDYINQLDLSEGDGLLKLFDETERYWHFQIVSGRKFFVIQSTNQFLKENPNGQVIILGAGLAPVSIEIASMFPSATVFDVDKFLLKEKEKLVNNNPPNISFLECDVTDVNMLHEKLFANGFNPEKPSIVLMEGIIYYLPEVALLNILKFFKQFDAALACDFCLQPDSVNDKTRIYLTEVFRKIMEQVNISKVYFYYEEQLIKLIKEAGFKNLQITNMMQIQKERTGNEFPFIETNSSWDKLIFAS